MGGLAQAQRIPANSGNDKQVFTGRRNGRVMITDYV
jgi:hypothetical protein